ncbi:MAG: hypothetical protein KME20_14460 [Kaiparowitsia implicata GSE-PSE-MK54-09C]|jgi:hypothetical protein|nr:hypothetical protein [Kaiparowitsia implicata GSE-PSE-MK54-09C]
MFADELAWLRFKPFGSGFLAQAVAENAEQDIRLKKFVKANAEHSRHPFPKAFAFR